MIDELEPLRVLRGDAPSPSAAARAGARAAWDGGPAALVTPRARPRQRAVRQFPARHFAARSAIAMTAVAAVVAAGLIVTHHRIDSVKPTHVVALGPRAEPAAGAPTTFLLVGSDSRAFVHTPAEVNQFGDPAAATGQRSDTMVLLRVDPSSHQVVAVSLPRDLLVEVPGCGSIKLDAVFNDGLVCVGDHGGAALLVDTVATDLRVPVDHVVEIGFDNFASLVDDLGGIRIQFPVSERDLSSGLNVDAGCRTLDGAQALSFVRARHLERLDHGAWEIDPLGDVGRMARQQVALRALAAAASARAGTDPRPLLRTLFANVTVDAQFTSDDALTLFDALRGETHTATLTLPVAQAGGELTMTSGAREVLDIVTGRRPLPSGLGTSIPATNESWSC
jgi:LCP family protein required for cell wall assembly